MDTPFFFVENLPDTAGIGEHTTVAAHVPGDNNANNCMAARFKNAMRHGNTAEAVTNLENRLNAKAGPLNISGHGMPGMIETGSGQSGWDLTKQISGWNTYLWEPLLARLKGRQFPVFSIYSCSTGADDAGADLLWEMSKILGTPVRARTGLTSCNGGITFQAGSTWQTATPTVRPAPIPETPHPFAIMMTKDLYLKRENLLFTTRSTSVSLCKAYLSSGFSEELEGEDAQLLAQVIFNQTMQDFSGKLLAILTHRFEFEMEEDGEQKIVEVDIYNDHVAVVNQFSALYFLPPNFRQYFSQMVYSVSSVSGLVKHPLRICKHILANITQQEADSILQSMTRIGSQCNFSFFRQGNLASFGNPANGIVNSQADFQAICSGGSAAVRGIQRSVYVVVKINWCGSLKPGIIGCANTPGICMVVVRYSASKEGQLWIHEFGHSKGLPHRDTSGAVMHSIINYGGEDFNSGECQSMRQLGVHKRSITNNPTPNENNAMNLKQYIFSTFIHGIPVDEVMRLGENTSLTELETLLPVFREAQSLQAVNIAALWCLTGQETFFEAIRSKIESGATNDNNGYPDDCLRCDLLMSLGYMAASSEMALNYLIESAEKVKAGASKNSISQSLTFSGSINGLALSGRQEAIAYLKTIEKEITLYPRELHATVYEASVVAEQINEEGLLEYSKKK